MLTEGDTVGLRVDSPAAGGRMIGRYDGQVLLISGAIPGEHVSVRIERTRKGVAHACVVTVEEASADRRDPFVDPRCGGCVYAHISYARQLTLKGEVVCDALRHIGRIDWPPAVGVAPSPETGYRTRARLHVRRGRAGFFREGSHDLCGARGTRQLLGACCDAVERLAAGLHSLGLDAVRELQVAEDLAAAERVVHLEITSPIDVERLAGLAGAVGLSGLTAGAAHALVVAGSPLVNDRLAIDAAVVPLSHHVLAFFQGNRYLLPALVSRVLSEIEPGSTVVDLYAGVGLFAVSAAVARQARVTAVEGDRLAVADLRRNAQAWGGTLTVVHQRVEAWVPSSDGAPDLVIVDPPRTGISPAALGRVVALGGPRVVYVSCDPATLARDARRLLDAGYALRRVDAFDLFPNTAHVETVATFER